MYTTAEFTPLFEGFGANMPPGKTLQPAQLTLPPKTPSCPDCTCPPLPDCGTPISPEGCAAIGFKTDEDVARAAAGGLKWWHLLLAGGAGIAIGYGAAQMMKSAKPSLHGYRRRW